MKSKKQVKVGETYWWQPREGCTAELVEVLKFTSNVLVDVKNVTPDRPYKQTLTQGYSTHSIEIDRPKGSVYGLNTAYGDVYDQIHIKHLTATEPKFAESLEVRGKLTNFAE